MKSNPELIVTLAIIVLVAVLAFWIGDTSGARKAKAQGREQRNRIIQQLAESRGSGREYITKTEALLDALICLDSNQTFSAEAIVARYVSAPAYEYDNFIELIEPTYQGFAQGYLYRVIRTELSKQ